MMSFVPLEQIVVTVLTGGIISGGQTDPAVILKRANISLTLAQSVQSLLAGNTLPSLTAIQGVLNKADADPAVSVAIMQLLAMFGNQATLLASVNKALSLGQINTPLVTNLLAGIITAANAEISKYQSATAVPVPKPATA